MFKRRWKWFGELISDEGFSLAYSHKGIRYTDERGSFEFGFEDGLLFCQHYMQVAGEPVSLSQSELNVIIDRIIAGVRFEGHRIEVYSK